MTNLIIFIILLMLGLFFGRLAEKKHYKSIVRRERRFDSIPAIASRYPPTDVDYGQLLVTGSTVVSSDYFKTVIAGIVSLFGGELKSFESLLDRARREAVLRMKEQAHIYGADMVMNIKMETARIAVGKVGAIEVTAYGTALVRNRTH